MESAGICMKIRKFRIMEDPDKAHGSNREWSSRLNRWFVRVVRKSKSCKTTGQRLRGITHWQRILNIRLRLRRMVRWFYRKSRKGKKHFSPQKSQRTLRK